METTVRINEFHFGVLKERKLLLIVIQLSQQQILLVLWKFKIHTLKVEII